MESALIALVGVLAGVVLRDLFARWLEQDRWEREDRQRWLRDKRELYARFTVAANVYDDAIRAHMERVDFLNRRDEDARIPIPEETVVALEELRLLAAPSVLTAAERVVELLNDEAESVTNWVVTGVKPSIVGDILRMTSYFDVRRHYIEAARADLGTGSSDPSKRNDLAGRRRSR